MNSLGLMCFYIICCIAPCLLAWCYARRVKRLSKMVEDLKWDLKNEREQKEYYRNNWCGARDEAKELKGKRTNQDVMEDFLGLSETTNLNKYSPKNLKKAIVACMEVFSEKTESKVKRLSSNYDKDFCCYDVEIEF